MSWAAGDLYGFDLETTGVDVFNDRIVTACVVNLRAGDVLDQHDWLIDPGVEIPEGAQKVHGISTEHARTHGQQPQAALSAIVGAVVAAFQARRPLVAFNANFDLSMLETECARHGVPGVVELVGDPDLVGVVDPIVIAREIDRVNRAFRKGRKYTLGDLCERYKVQLDNAHDAAADAIAACRLLATMVESEPHLAQYGPAAIHKLQRTAYREDKLRFREWLINNQRADEAPGIDTQWPLRSQEVDA